MLVLLIDVLRYPIHYPRRANPLLLGLLLWLSSSVVRAQMNDMPVTAEVIRPAVPQKDVIDLLRNWFPRLKANDSTTLRDGGKVIWILPQIGYTLQTKLLAQVLVNAAFRQPNANVSTLTGTAAYTQNSQAIFTATSSVWSRDNRFLFTNDWRLMRYPQATYGLGMYTSTERRVVDMDYSYLRAYQSILTRVVPNLYAGVGYALDLHWDIRSYNSRHEFTRISGYQYGITGRSVASGPLLAMTFDNRANSINPQRGTYANAVLRTNLQFLGSDRNYQSLLIDIRKYIHLNPTTDNILALWSYNNITLRGNPPFLDLPSTGWDTNGNVGRGHIQGRFRGKKFLYAEAAYRFQITANRLLGGVVFANAQSVSELNSNRFERVAPAVGAGLRIKMNKFSRTNLCVDYGLGLDGTGGLFFNLGEVF